jgi:hypothetical protein
MTNQSRSDSSNPANLSGLFLQPSTPPPSSIPPQLSSMSPDESSSPTNSPATELPTDDWSVGSLGAGQPIESDRDDSSNPPSTGELPKGSLAGRGELRKTVTAGVIAATSAAHELLADDDGKSLGAFLADDEEVDGIADAAAGLLSRRVPAGVGNPDVTDLVKLGLILAGYIGRQFRIRRQIKAMRAGAVATPVQPDDDFVPSWNPDYDQ